MTGVQTCALPIFLVVWSCLVFVWFIFVVIWANIYCGYLIFFFKFIIIIFFIKGIKDYVWGRREIILE